MRYNCLKQLLFRGSPLIMMVLLASSIAFAKNTADTFDSTVHYRYVLIVPEVAKALCDAVEAECCGCPEVETVVQDINRGMRSCTWDNMMCALDVALKRVNGDKKTILTCYRDELERQARDSIAVTIPVTKRSFNCNPSSGCSGAVPPNFSNDIGVLTGVRAAVCTGPCLVGEPCPRPACPQVLCPLGPTFPCQPPFNITACASAVPAGELFCLLAAEGLFIECDSLSNVTCPTDPFANLPVDILCDVCQPVPNPQPPIAPVLPNITGGGKVLLCDVEVLTIVGNTGLFGELGVEEDINVLGNGIFGGNLDVNGNVRIGGSLDVGSGVVGGGALQIAGDGTIAGNVCIGDGLRVNNGLCTNGDALINGNLLVDESIVVNDDITAGGQICAVGGLCASGPVCVNDVIADRIKARVACIDDLRFEQAVGGTACIDFVAADTIISDLICVDDLVFEQGKGGDAIVNNATVTGLACINNLQAQNAFIENACVNDLQAVQFRANNACISDLDAVNLRSATACIVGLQTEELQARNACIGNGNINTLNSQVACFGDVYADRVGAATGVFDSLDVCQELVQDLFIQNIVQFNGSLSGLCWPQAFGELVFTAGDFCRPLCSILPTSETGCFSVVEGFVYLPYNFTGSAQREVVCGAEIPNLFDVEPMRPGRLPHVDFLVPADYDEEFELDVCVYFPDNFDGFYTLRAQIAHAPADPCNLVQLPPASISIEQSCQVLTPPPGRVINAIVKFRIDGGAAGATLSPGDWIRVALDFSNAPENNDECLPMVNSMVFRYSRVDVNEAGAIFPG